MKKNKNSTDTQYLNLLKTILKNGRTKSDRTGTGIIGTFGYQMRFDISDGSIPLLTTKKVHTKSIIHELLWMLKGNTNIQYLNKNGVSIWNEWPYENYKKWHSINVPDTRILDITEFAQRIIEDDAFADKFGDCGPIYGKQWVSWQSPNDMRPINQIAEAIETLKNNPESRRIIVNAWNVADLKHMSLPPCPCFFQFYATPLTLKERSKIAVLDVEKKTHEKFDETGVPRYALSCQMYQRSADSFLGVPFDMVTYSVLTHMIAQIVNMIPKEFIHVIGDAHIYNNHIEQVKLQLSREPMIDTAQIILNKDISDIFKFTYDDLKIVNYNSHSAIKGTISI
jgi:thymidylate synthase